MSNLPSPRQTDAGLSTRRATELERPSGLVLTPAEKIARRRNRRWLLGVFVPSVGVLVAALIASGVAQSNAPKASSPVVPAGYRQINNGYFAYVVPSSWSANGAYSDGTGDLDMSGLSGWSGEHLGYRTTAPVLGEAQPASLAAFNINPPAPYRLSDGHSVAVRGAAVAYAYTMSRPGGFTAAVIDAWDARADVEMWLVVHASPDVTARVLASLS